MWNELIDCGETATQEVVVTSSWYDWNCNCFYTGSQEWIECVDIYCDGNISNCLQTTTYTIEVNVNGQSDGFICRNSQVINGIPQSDIYQANEANHSEEVIHASVRTQINRIVNGERGPGDFFTTEPR